VAFRAELGEGGTVQVAIAAFLSTAMTEPDIRQLAAFRVTPRWRAQPRV
jgi:hypothetical protein